ncbi:MAG: hypothetical protein JSV96_04160, partial [Candidatus Aminicenantes bacterium]
ATVEQMDSSQTVEIGVDDRGVDLNYLDGIIDDVRIYKRALSASEILALYTNQVDQEFISDASNLVYNVGLNCMYTAQTFTAGVTGTLTGVNIALRRAGDTPYPLRVAIHSVENGIPTWVELASTLVMPENQKDSWQEALEYLVTFQPGVQVQAGVQYAIVVNYVGASTGWPPEGIWRGSTTDPLYSGGSDFSAECTGDTGPVWHPGSYDLFFRTYVSITI